MRAVRGVVIVAAACIAIVAAAGNGWYWWRVNEGTLTAQLLGVTFSVLAGTLKIGVPVWVASQGLKWRQRPKLILVAAMAFLFDAWSGVGYVGLIRDDANAARKVASRAADDARAILPALQQRLDALGKADKPATWYPAQIAVQETVAGACPVVKVPSEPCKLLATYKAQFATAQEREKAERALTEAQRVAASAPADAARPEVAPVARALASFGLVVHPDLLASIWSVALLVFVEIVPVAVVADILRRPVAPPAPPAPVRAPVVLTPGPTPKPRPTSAGAVDILTAIASLPVEADGWHTSSQRHLATAAKASAATVGRAVKAAVAAGQLEIQRTAHGTRFRVVTS